MVAKYGSIDKSRAGRGAVPALRVQLQDRDARSPE
jgi:hypothetical protein